MVTILEQIFFKFAKGIEKVKVCAFDAIIVAFSTVVFNILALVILKVGLNGYLVAMILSKAVSCIYIMVGIKAWEYFSMKSINKLLIFDMLKYSIPFIPTAVAWWINTASDRYIIVAFCGVAANGLYSIGSKIPSLLSIFTSIFQQAWQISSIKEYREDGYSEFFSNIYCNYAAVIGMGCSLIILFAPLIAKFTFKNDFYNAWVFTPYLLLGTMFSGISGVLASLFNAAKKNGQLAISTISGAIINIGMNLCFVNIIGALGAAIATAVSFFIV